MPKTIWKGSLQFGLVGFPIELKPAVRSDHVPFRLLHADDLSPVHMERVDEGGDPVPWDEVVKGYETEKGRFVVMTDEDFRAAALKSSRAFEICDFVAEGEIDPRFFDTPYYLTPGKGGEKAYAILREALARARMVGIGRVMIRQKQHLAALKTVGDALVLETMRFVNELVQPREYRFPRAQLATEHEVKVAEELVRAMAGEFDPEKYHDAYRENLMRIIRAKSAGKPVEAEEEPEAEETGIIDLMSRLKASLERAEGRRSSSAASTRHAKASSATKKSSARKSSTGKASAGKAKAKQTAAKKSASAKHGGSGRKTATSRTRKSA